jgi:Kef-type K+ transport system membrane component KefB
MIARGIAQRFRAVIVTDGGYLPYSLDSRGLHSMKRRLLLYYLGLAALLVAVAVTVFTVGADTKAQPAIAGGYDVAGGRECLGGQVDLRQSGQFITVQRADGTSIGSLRLRDGTLTGEITCRGGDRDELTATLRGGRLTGTVGARPLSASFGREPPEAGRQRPRVPRSVEGTYTLTPPSRCLGGTVELHDGELDGRAGRLGTVTYTDGRLSGSVRCETGTATLRGQAADRQITLVVAGAGETERVVAVKRREFGRTLAAFFLAVVVVMLAARLVGACAARIGQPRVMGEVLAGILLGPTVLGALGPGVQQAIFPSDIVPHIGVAANLGLIFYMFLVGLELDVSQLKGRVTQTTAISNTGVAIPMMAGLAVAIPTYQLVGPDTGFAAFALFMGVSMSITAFPVLARILVERRMLKRPVGALALASAAVDDVTAWFLIALATAVAVAGSFLGVARTVGLAVLFCVVMGVGVRRLLRRASVAYDEAGRVPVAWITAIFAGVLLSAYATEEIGIALIFGAFIMGAVMPRHAGLTEDVTHRVEDFVVLLLLPLFFAYTGLRSNIGLLDRPELILLTVGLIAVAIICKFGGTILAARVVGLGWRESAVLGALMNTRGLTELIVLNLALEKGVISEALFAALVLMALVTTFMAGPMLKLIDPANTFGAPVEEEIPETLASAETPTLHGSILVASQTTAATDQLLAIATPLARAVPPREIVLTRLLAPPRGASVRGALQTQQRELDQASAELTRHQTELRRAGATSRVAAFTSTEIGTDLVRLGEREDVDLVLLDGRRPLLGGDVPRGDVGVVLDRAPSDVAVLVAREDAVIDLGHDATILVPFGGMEHDWAALELGAWLASSTGATLSLLGSAGQTEDGRDSTRLLANASLLVQRFVGVHAETLIVEPGGDSLIAAARDAELLVVGLADDWRSAGLGTTRAQIAAAAPAPLVFVRRGTRPGALAPRTDVTRFNWTSAGPPPSPVGEGVP